MAAEQKGSQYIADLPSLGTDSSPVHPWPFVSDVAIFVLKGDVKLQLITNRLYAFLVLGFVFCSTDQAKRLAGKNVSEMPYFMLSGRKTLTRSHSVGFCGRQLAGDVTHKPSSKLPLLSARPAVTFPASGRHRPCPVSTAWWTGSRVCERGQCATAERSELEPASSVVTSPVPYLLSHHSQKSSCIGVIACSVQVSHRVSLHQNSCAYRTASVLTNCCTAIVLLIA